MKRNIDLTGRLARAGLGVFLLVSALLLAPFSKWIAAAFVCLGLFCLFAGLRGWCFARACGIKTRL